MTGVSDTLKAKRDAGDGALIGYLPVGFPTFDESVDAAIAVAENGVDIIELGVPYSDPVMDGPVIQAATQRALAEGFRLSHAFEAVRRITEAVDTRVLLMTYWNPVVQYGVERFADDLVAAGGAGLITPDLIPTRERNGSRHPSAQASTACSSRRRPRATHASCRRSNRAADSSTPSRRWA